MRTVQRGYFLWTAMAVVALGFVYLSRVDSPRGKPEKSDQVAIDSFDSGKRLNGEPKPAVPHLPPDSSESHDPVEVALANGRVLATQTESLGSDRLWQRVRLVETEIQPRPVRVVERWDIDEGIARATKREMFLADQVLIQVKEGVNRANLASRMATSGIQVLSEVSPGFFTLRLPSADIDAVPQAMDFLAEQADVITTVEADGVGFGSGVPNDPQFGNQWGHRNTGQFGGSVPGTDVAAPDFWGIVGNAKGLVIAVLDSGINSSHPDLQNVARVNPAEIPGNGVDDDGNGRIDDINGWDFVNNDNNPNDDHGHGTNISGILVANRDNGTGIAGLLPGAKILVGKILNASNSGLTSNVIAGLAYARMAGVPVINLSLQSYPFSAALSAEITACENAGILIVVSAGNLGTNNDVSPNYPSSYTHANVLSVGSHSLDNTFWNGTPNPSNFGANSVDVLAPGRFIYSTHLASNYVYFTGTSQATAYVSAIAGAIKFANPQWTPAQIKAAVMTSAVTSPTYQGVCVSSGRVNAVKAVARSFVQNPSMDTDSDQVPNLIEYLAGSMICCPTSKPPINHELIGGQFRISIPTVSRPEATLQVEASTNLVNWGTAGVVDLSGPGTLVGGIPPSSSTRTFLRIKAVPTPP